MLTALGTLRDMLFADPSLIVPLNKSSDMSNLLDLQFHISDDVRNKAQDLLTDFGIGDI